MTSPEFQNKIKGTFITWIWEKRAFGLQLGTTEEAWKFNDVIVDVKNLQIGYIILLQQVLDYRDPCNTGIDTKFQVPRLPEFFTNNSSQYHVPDNEGLGITANFFWTFRFPIIKHLLHNIFFLLENGFFQYNKI